MKYVWGVVAAVVIIAVIWIAVNRHQHPSVPTVTETPATPPIPAAQPQAKSRPAKKPIEGASPVDIPYAAPVAVSTVTVRPEPIEIVGPLSERRFIRKVIPRYPYWAQVAGRTAILRYRIQVTPKGRVRSTYTPLQLADQRFQREATKALKQWTFEEVPDSVGDQTGDVTFRFTLDMNAIPTPAR